MTWSMLCPHEMQQRLQNDRKAGRNVSIGVVILKILLKTLIPVLRM